VVNGEPPQVRTGPVKLTDPESVIRLGQTAEGHQPFGFSVTLQNEDITSLRWRMGYPPEHSVDSIQLSVHRDEVRCEEDAQVLLTLACELQPILAPVIGYIEDYAVEMVYPVPSKYGRNSHDLPNRIRWANLWGPTVVSRLGGQKKIMMAPADKVRIFGDGGVLLLSTPNLLTYGNARDAARRQDIWEWFELDRLHEELSHNKDQERF
jgi:hypothetical protein